MLSVSIPKVYSHETTCCDRSIHCVHVASSAADCYACTSNTEHDRCACSQCSGVKEPPPMVLESQINVKISKNGNNTTQEKPKKTMSLLVSKKGEDAHKDLRALRLCLSVFKSGKEQSRHSVFPKKRVHDRVVSSQKLVERKILRCLAEDGVLSRRTGKLPWNQNSKIEMDIYKLINTALFEKLVNDDDYLCKILWPAGIYRHYDFSIGKSEDKAVSSNARKNTAEEVEKSSNVTQTVVKNKDTGESQNRIDEFFIENFDTTAKEMLSGFLRITQASAESQIYTRESVDSLRQEVKALNVKIDSALTLLNKIVSEFGIKS